MHLKAFQVSKQTTIIGNDVIRFCNSNPLGLEWFPLAAHVWSIPSLAQQPLLLFPFLSKAETPIFNSNKSRHCLAKVCATLLTTSAPTRVPGVWRRRYLVLTHRIASTKESVANSCNLQGHPMAHNPFPQGEATLDVACNCGVVHFCNQIWNPFLRGKLFGLSLFLGGTAIDTNKVDTWSKMCQLSGSGLTGKWDRKDKQTNN